TACSDGAPRYVALPAPLDLAQNKKRGLTLHFKPLDALSCTGTLQGASYNTFAEMGARRAFAASAPLADGRVLIAGGAVEVDGEVFRADETADAWEIYAPGESLFLPGIDRAQAIEPRAMIAPRVAAQAFPYAPKGADRPGVLVVGGVPAMRRGTFPFGPLAPVEGPISRPEAEFFDPEKGVFAPVLFADGAVLSERFLTGGAVDDAGRVVLVGGVQWPEGAPSGRIEIIEGDTLRTLDLPPDAQSRPTGLFGPTVTPLGEGRFFIWGADARGCGEQPGWLLMLEPTPRIGPLEVIADDPVLRCGDEIGDRRWYPTAYHVAARLPDADGHARVLITGGIIAGTVGLISNPDPGDGRKPNAFVAEIDIAGRTVQLHPVTADFEAQGRLKRAFHRAARVADDRVLLTGGWVALETSTALYTADDALLYTDGRPAGRISVLPQSLAAQRLGHLSVELPGRGVLLAGGLSRKPGEGFQISP
ncbi:MAG: hypothetical protein KC620_25705, partial [Myxococcales bacterium]|nr:hypothetical protein [Myxococcales bacterium]